MPCGRWLGPRPLGGYPCGIWLPADDLDATLLTLERALLAWWDWQIGLAVEGEESARRMGEADGGADALARDGI